MTRPEDTHLARAFRALSHPRRARLFRLLAENPGAGASFLQLQLSARMSTSSLTHHIREMERCGLVRRRRKGNVVAYGLVTSSLTGALQEAGLLVRQVERPQTRAA